MKSIKQKASITLLLIVCFLCSFIVPVSAEVKLPGFEIIQESKSLKLYMNKKNAEIAVENKENGYIYYSNPVDKQKDFSKGFNKFNLYSQLIVESDTTESNDIKQTNSFSNSVKDKNFKIEKDKNGVVVTFKFKKLHYSIPVRYSLEEDAFKAEVLADKIVEEEFEQKEKKNDKTIIKKVFPRIKKISLLPYFGAANGKSEGYMLTPDGSGGLIYLNNGKKSAQPYDEPVYGDDPALRDKNFYTKEKINLPVFGMKNGDNSFLAVIDEGAANADIHANVNGQFTGYNTIYSIFKSRVIDSVYIGKQNTTYESETETKFTPKGICREKYSVKYYFLNGENSDYNGMAKRYKEILFKDSKKSDAKTTPLYLTLYGAEEYKSTFLGIPVKKKRALTTYDDALDIIKSLEEKGVTDFTVNYKDMLKSSVQGKISKKFDLEGKLGGKRAFNKLNDYMNSKNYSLYPSANLSQFQKSGNGVSKYKDAIKSLSKLPVYKETLTLSNFGKDNNVPINMFLRFDAVQKNLDKFLPSLEKAGMKNLSLDKMGNDLYSSYENNITERESSIEKVVNNIKKVSSQKLLFSGADAYALPYATNVIDVPLTCNLLDIQDESIPFYHMVLRGNISYATEAINLNSNSKEAVLRALETGSNLQYVLVARNIKELRESKLNFLYSADYKRLEDIVAKQYKDASEVLNKVTGAPIKKHEKVSDGIYKTTYDNGVYVIVNYNDTDKVVEGSQVSAKSYRVVEAKR